MNRHPWPPPSHKKKHVLDNRAEAVQGDRPPLRGRRRWVSAHLFDHGDLYEVERHPTQAFDVDQKLILKGLTIDQADALARAHDEAVAALYDERDRLLAVVEKARLRRNARIGGINSFEAVPGFIGEWVAVPAEDFDALRAALAAVNVHSSTHGGEGGDGS